MKAWLLDSQTGLGALRFADAPDPVPGPGEVVIKVRFAALNPADRYLAEKQYPGRLTFPHILGRDGIGEVIAIGPDVAGVKVGDTRAILRGDTGLSRPGTFAQRVVVAADALISVPAGWTPEQTAAAPLVYLTAWQALTTWGPLPDRATVLVTGASGGVGVASVQLAHAMGFDVIALSRSLSKQEELKKLGAKLAIDPSEPNWSKNLLKALSGRRVDLAIDNIGGPQFPQLIETLGEHGRISVVGRLAGPVPQFNTSSLLFRRLRIGGIAVGAYGADEAQGAWRQIIATLAKTGARPQVDRIFPLGELLAAFDRLHEGPMGKVLIAVQ